MTAKRIAKLALVGVAIVVLLAVLAVLKGWVSEEGRPAAWDGSRIVSRTAGFDACT